MPRYRIDRPTPEEFARATPFISRMGEGITFPHPNSIERAAIMQVGLWLQQEFTEEHQLNA